MKCSTKFCRNERSLRKLVCSKCAMRAWRAANPEAKILAWLRNRAKRKKFEFDLDLEWLTTFLRERGYNPADHHIDRISAGKGYVKGNLQILPISDNIAKGNRERGPQLQIL